MNTVNRYTTILLTIGLVLWLEAVVTIEWSYRPEISLGLEGYYRYADFRPVRFGFIKSSAADCMPSRFWFPDGWRQN